MKFAFVLTAFLSFSVLADVTNFKCAFSDMTYVNQFSVEASVAHENGEFFNAQFNLFFRKAGKDSSIESFSLSRDGTVQVLEAGTFFPFETVRVASAVKNDEVEYVNFLIDVPPLHSSQIRFRDGMTYFGSCKSL